MMVKHTCGAFIRRKLYIAVGLVRQPHNLYRLGAPLWTPNLPFFFVLGSKSGNVRLFIPNVSAIAFRWTVYDDKPLDSININICQLQRNPHLETTTRTRLNPKHIDEGSGIVQETASKISQAVRSWWHVRRWGWVRLDSGNSLGRVGRGKLSAIVIVILLDALHGIIRLARYIEKEGPKHRSNRVCWGWNWFGSCLIPIHVDVWNLRGLQILLCV